MKVRRLTQVDKELVYKCDELFVSFCDDQEKYDYNYQKTENMNSFISDLESDEKFLLCIEQEKEVQGFLYGYIEKKKNMKEKIANLVFIYVKEEYREQNIGAKLINEYMNILKENNVDIIEVKAYENNNVAKNLYKKMGFNALWTNYRKRI